MSTENLLYITTVTTGLLLLTIIWQGIRLYKLDKFRKEFFSAELKKNLDEVLVDQNRSLLLINKQLKLIDKNIDQILQDNQNNFQKIGFVRFNPFDDSGGNVSFALALLNDHDDGFVISSLHGREGTRVYAKTIQGALSESKLTDEELQAIKKAK